MPKTKKKAKKRKGNRRGTYLHSLCWDGGSRSEFNVKVLFVVEELEQVGGYSKIKILHVEGINGILSESKIKGAKDYIGQYLKTQKVTWDESEEYSEVEKESEQEKIIKTPMKDLVKQIEMENIRDM